MLCYKNKKISSPNKKPIQLGTYVNEIDAAEAVDMYLVHNPGYGHIKLNFPVKKKEYLKNPYVPPTIKKKDKIYHGVSKAKEDEYRIRITVNGKQKQIGQSKDPVEAAKMWDKYVIENKIPYRKLNFPDDYPDQEPMAVKTFYKDIDDKVIKLVNENLKNVSVFVDRNDYDRLKHHSWYITKKGYIRTNMNGGQVGIHRYLKNAADPAIFIDHKDSNKFNNVQSNLRQSNAKKNPKNSKKRKNTISAYIGIYRKNNKKWSSRIRYEGKDFTIGTDQTEEYAARRRDLFIIENYPNEHYKLNFKWTEENIHKWKAIFSDTLKMIEQDSKIIGDMKNILNAVFDDDFEVISQVNTISSYNNKKTLEKQFQLDDLFGN